MRHLIHSKAHIIFFVLLVLAFGIIDFFPVYGSPFFRYTGSDPQNLVWNFGWPIAWFIYDEINPPYGFAWLGSWMWALFLAQGAVIGVCLIVLWMIRKRDS